MGIINLITLIEQLIGVAAQGVTQLKGVLSSGADTDAALADADATYAAVIASAQAILDKHNPPAAT